MVANFDWNVGDGKVGLANSKILITGGTGSFGRAMISSLLSTDCQEIRVFSRDEEKQDFMRGQIADERLRYYIGDVRDRASLDAAIAGANMVFHAAALKQVPSCEFFPIEAVRTNVFGSSNVVEAAIAAGVESLVCLSTDKAVFPINAMGMTKALMEKIARAAARRLKDCGVTISCVRYGNVMYSRGSVIPLFIRQIQSAVPITITEPSMTRFMLPLNQAVQLVHFALENAKQGDIFIRKSPACTIADLVTALLEMFNANNEVKVIGMRHGEKIYETLASAEEMRSALEMSDYFRLAIDERNLNYASYYTKGDTKEANTAHYHSHNTTRLSVSQLKDLLRSLPEISAQLDRRMN